MIRGFYSSSLGLISQQNYLNTIGNNVANINTTAFKPQVTAFSALLYEDVDGGAGTNISTGHGSKVQKNGLDLTQGDLLPTGLKMDCAIDGAGFFAIRDKQTNTVSYTRDGSFGISVEGNQNYLVNSSGDYVLGKNNNIIDVTNGFDKTAVGIFSFSNPYGLELLGSNQYAATNLSGQAAADNVSTIRTGYLESSGTDASKEMVRMIEAQRAYQMNAKILQSTDEMEKVANQLR